MEANKNISFWKTICQSAACVDLALQILSAIGIISVCVLMAQTQSVDKIELNLLVLIGILILLITFIQIYLIVVAIMLIKACFKTRNAEDASNLAIRWRRGQFICLFLAVSALTKGFLECGIISGLIRLTMICIASKFIHEVKKGTGNSCENLVV